MCVHVCMCYVYVIMHVACTCASMHECLYVRTYAPVRCDVCMCLYACMYACKCMYVGRYARMHACILCMCNACMLASVYVCEHKCIFALM